MVRRIGVSALAAVLVGMFWVGSAAAATSPIQLLVPQGTAFSVLHYDCGGIGEHAYATGFDTTIDPAAGYPTGDVFLTTTCNGSGRGGHSFTVTAWTTDTWDLTGALLSYSVLSGAPTVDPNFTATDPPTANQVYNTTNFRCTSQTGAVPSACLQLAPTFTPRPRVTGISSTQEPATGGTSVTISGDAFTAATNVYFGTTQAASYIVNSDTSITAVSPADTSGISPDAIDVTVVSAGGTSFTSSNDQFTSYRQPSVTAVSPNNGPMGGGYYVTVTGTNFVGTTGVNDGDTPTAFQVINNSTLSVYIVPGETAGDQIDITATSPGGTSPVTSADQFTYNPPPMPPSAPTATKAVSGPTTTSTGPLTVRYTAGANNGATITKFTATCASTNGGVTNTDVHNGATAAPITVTALTTAKTYKCTVKATNSVGTGPASALSAPVIVGAPAAPTGVSATHWASGQIKVSFTAGANNGSAITSYTATCTSNNGGTTKSASHAGATAAPITVTSLTIGKTYRCTVTERNARGTSPPSSPSGVVAA